MNDAVKPIPDNYRRVNTCLIVTGVAKALAFYTEAFGAAERSRFPGPGGMIPHAELEIGDSVLMVEEASELIGKQAPPPGGFPGSPEYHLLYVEDPDATIDRAVELGATLKRPAADQFYGDRDGFIVDPFGHGWVIAAHREDVPAAELARRISAMFGQR